MLALTVTAVAALSQGESLALSGEHAIVTRQRDNEVRVLSQPLAGGRPSELLRFAAPRGHTSSASLAASPERVAAVVHTDSRRYSLALYQSFAGPPDGPLEAVTPRRHTRDLGFVTGPPAVDGPRSIFSEFRFGPFATRTIVREPGLPDVRARLPRNSFAGGFAGDLAAADGARFTRVVNWRTGEVLRKLPVDGGAVQSTVRADGTIAYEGRDSRIRIARPGEPPRPVGRAGRFMWAGDRLLLARDKGLTIVEPDGTRRAFGVPSASIGAVAADAGTVVWQANDCLLAAPVEAPAAVAPEPGACARTELKVGRFVPYRDGRARLTMKCFAGPGGVCAGTIVLPRRTRPFRLGMGERLTIHPRLARGAKLSVRYDGRVERRWVVSSAY